MSYGEDQGVQTSIGKNSSYTGIDDEDDDNE